MALRDLIKTGAERAADLKKKQRMLELSARKGVAKLDECAADLEQQRTELWRKAGQYLKTGQKTEAENLVRQHKSRGIMLNRLQQQKFVIESRLTQLTIATTIGEIVGSVASFGQSLNLDVASLDVNMDNINNMLDNAEATWDVLGRTYDRDVRKMKAQAESSGADDIASEMAALEREAAASVVKAPKAAEAAQKVAPGDINEGLNNIEERLSKLQH